MFPSVPTRREIENSKTIAKKFKKLKNTITGSFQANIGRKRQRKTEIKVIDPFRSYPALNRKLKKIAKKFKKLKNTIMNFISNQKKLEKDKKERK